MKYFKQYPLLFLLLLGVLFLTGAGLCGRNGVYEPYRQAANAYNPAAWVLVGMKNGVPPWAAFAWAGKPEEDETGGETTDVNENAAGGETADGQESAAGGETADEQGSAAGGETADEQESAAGGETADEQESAPEEETTYAFETVDESYFDDALFIGDSRTVGLWEYAGMEERADFFCKTSLTIWDVLEKPIVKKEDGRMITVEEALTERTYGKIYLMVGINELGRGNTELFMEQYRTVVDRIRQLQPEAVLFVEGIMRVSGDKNRTDPIFNNQNINDKNEHIALLADNRNIFYIDVNEAVCDENGDLTAEYTFDQIHLKAAYYQLWKEFLLEHAIVK